MGTREWTAPMADAEPMTMAEMVDAYGWPAATLRLWAKDGHIKPVGGGGARRGARYDPGVVYQVAGQRQAAHAEQCRTISKKPRGALRLNGMSKADANLQWNIARAQRAQLELAARSGELVTTACVEDILGKLGRIANEGHAQTRNKLTAMVGAEALRILDDEHARTMARMVEEIQRHGFQRWAGPQVGGSTNAPTNDENDKPKTEPPTLSNSRTKGTNQDE